jgi:hypothetical protein
LDASARRPSATARRRRTRRSAGSEFPAAFAGAYFTDAIGIHAVLGAFLVGAAMPRPSGAAQGFLDVRRRLSTVVAILAPVYFVTTLMTSPLPRGLRRSSRSA